MNLFKNMLKWSIYILLLNITNVHAAIVSASCSFDNCSAQVNISSFQVTCAEKEVYRGSYELTTDLQTTRVQAENLEGPQIIVITKSLATLSSKMNATLVMAGKSITG